MAQRGIKLYERPTVSTEPLWLGLGDTMFFLPSIKKLSKILNSKIDIITQHPQLFNNSPYVSGIFNLQNYNFKIQDGNPYFFAPLRNKTPFWFNIEPKQYIAHCFGFDLLDQEKSLEFYAEPFIPIDLPKKYVLITPAKRGIDRDFGKEGWQKLIDILNANKVTTVLEGAGDFHELDVKLGLNLCGKINSIGQTWHLINKSNCYVAFDIGMYILAGSTGTQIFLIDSYFEAHWHKPFRNGSLDYKLKVIEGECAEKCLGNLKYYVRESGLSQFRVQQCQLGYDSFKCIPSIEKVAEQVVNYYNASP